MIRSVPGELRPGQLAASSRVPAEHELRDDTDSDSCEVAPRLVEFSLRRRAELQDSPQHDPLPQAREEPRRLGALLHHDRSRGTKNRGLRGLQQV